MNMIPTTIAEYLRTYAGELEQRILEQFPPLHSPGDPEWPEIGQLRRRPFASQSVAIHGIAKRLDSARTAAVIAECGTGKTLVSLGAVCASSRGRKYTCLVLMPPHVCLKWARECCLTLPRVRVFIVDGVRNGAGANGYTGVNEVRLRNGKVVREGLHTTLSDMRLAKGFRSARERWDASCDGPSVFLMSREVGKLSYHWKHAYEVPHCGPHIGNVVNPDTGRPILMGEDQLRRSDFKQKRLSEVVSADLAADPNKARRQYHSPLWQADREKVRRFAPAEFISRYLSKGFFDYAIADEVHELKGGDTAQGQALATLANCAEKIIVLTGTLLGGYATELYHILFRLDPAGMISRGFEHGDAGLRAFSECYGVLEKITVIEERENACSKAKVTRRVRQRPGASPLLFGHFLLNLGAFVSLEDISDTLPPYREEVINVEMDPILKRAYSALEEDVKGAIKGNPGNASVLSTGLNALLLYPDRPFSGLGPLYGHRVNEEGQRERFVISDPAALDESLVYAKEKRLLEIVHNELKCGRNVQIFAVYTQKRDVTRRLAGILEREGIPVSILTADVPPEQRETWYERELKRGMRVCITHPKIVQTGLDLVALETLVFVQTGYSIYTLRQASRRSWRIGQKNAVKVLFLTYNGTAQESCLRLMGKKLLVSMALEGKFSSEGLQALDSDDDVLTAMARELVTRDGIGERAEAVWRALQEQREIISPIPGGQTIVLPAKAPDDGAVDVALFAPGNMPVEQTALFAASAEVNGPAALAAERLTRKRSSRRSGESTDQLSLAF
jgi:superfamily II DNA or RNA helicase